MWFGVSGGEGDHGKSIPDSRPFHWFDCVFYANGSGYAPPRLSASATLTIGILRRAAASSASRGIRGVQP
jgi:hypothetical protein